ncbi:phosphate ABC transporter permease subunit PstC [Oscillibacter ruminantium]|uniref:phosphate ABC transporter permease subunit PstC n=1 Tax=Oscillibacter ruminantium TaxID=1263547 RepID=UPI0002F1A180|nr:phosphate ABC transporter permease subunit PstC [Oscillibacter ruminantium]
MRTIGNFLFSNLIKLLTLLTVLSLAFVLIFIVQEALPAFSETSLTAFLFGQRWMPMDYGNGVSFGIGNFIAGTLAVSALAILIALLIGVGAAVFLSCAVSENARSLLYPLIDLLAGIPSVIYGFIGLCVLVKLFQRLGIAGSGHSVLTAAILLAVMLLPFLVSSCSETMLKIRRRYLPAASALGISYWHTVAHVVLPLSARNILLSVILATGRAMGETMAVMMVMGNANLFPTLLGKGETIASLIALEMGTAAAGSTHYHALYAAGLVLLVILLAINTGIALLRRRLLRQEGA